MKVIKEGTAHLANVICNKCKSELQCEQEDIKHATLIYADKYEETRYYVECPVCNNNIIMGSPVIKYIKPKKKKWWQCFIEDSDWPPM